MSIIRGIIEAKRAYYENTGCELEAIRISSREMDFLSLEISTQLVATDSKRVAEAVIEVEGVIVYS